MTKLADISGRIARGGATWCAVRVLLDAAGSWFLPENFFQPLLAARAEVRRFNPLQPQILHAKLIIADGIIYVGSSNLDIRSLNLKYELMLRFTDKTATVEALEIFENALRHFRKIELHSCRKAQTCWSHWKNHWAHFLVARIDPLVALRQFRMMV